MDAKVKKKIAITVFLAIAILAGLYFMIRFIYNANTTRSLEELYGDKFGILYCSDILQVIYALFFCICSLTLIIYIWGRTKIFAHMKNKRQYLAIRIQSILLPIITVVLFVISVIMWYVPISWGILIALTVIAFCLGGYGLNYLIVNTFCIIFKVEK